MADRPVNEAWIMEYKMLSAVYDKAVAEIIRANKQKKFGLVFEEHLPECTPLYDIAIKKGSTVAKKTDPVNEMYEVNSIKDGIATCYHKVSEKKEEIPVDIQVYVANILGNIIDEYQKYDTNDGWTYELRITL